MHKTKLSPWPKMTMLGFDDDEFEFLVERAEAEDPYVLPPDLSAKLRTKARIMSRHWTDIDRLYPWPHQRREPV